MYVQSGEAVQECGGVYRFVFVEMGITYMGHHMYAFCATKGIHLL